LSAWTGSKRQRANQTAKSECWPHSYFQGALYASVVERFAQGVEIYQDTCTGLVQEIEAGRLDGPETRQILNQALQPMLQAGIDTVVLGCTHYPLVIPQIQSICGPQVRVIDPAPAVARQTDAWPGRSACSRVRAQHHVFHLW
jgi:glutamate racemase